MVLITHLELEKVRVLRAKHLDINIMRHREEDTRAETPRVSSYTLGSASLRMGSAIYPSLGTSFIPNGCFEVMDDVVGEFETQNDCYHYSDNWTSSPPVPFNVSWTGTNPGTIISGSLSGAPGLSLNSVFSPHTVPHSPSASDVDRWEIPDWSSEGWYNIYPTIQQQVSGLNAIYELKDFRNLFPLLKRTQNSYRDLYSWFGKNPVRLLTRQILGIDRWGWTPPNKRDRQVMLRRLQSILRVPVAPVFRKDRPLVEILRDLSDLAPEHFLNWNFALKPFMMDLAGFAGASQKTKKRVDELLEKADGTVWKGHYNRDLTAYQSGIDFEIVDDDPPWVSRGADTYRLVSELSDVKYTLSVHYSFTFPGVTREMAHKLGYLDSIGVTPNFGNLWRAAKWTFIIDWFLKIGSMLDRLSPHLLEPVVNIHGGCHSVKYTLTTNFELSPWREYRNEANYVYSLADTTIVATREQDVYVRKMRIPSLLGLPKTSDFSTMEKLLALALGLTMRRGIYATGH